LPLILNYLDSIIVTANEAIEEFDTLSDTIEE